MRKSMHFKGKIKNLALKNRVPAQAVLQSFMLERLLERVSASKYKHKIILKGGMLIASLVGMSSRTTMDMDASLRDFPLTPGSIQTVFSEICAIQLEDDVTLRLDHIVPIRADDEYGGYRVSIIAIYELINTPLKIDITTGDIITPGAMQYAFPSSFEDKMIEIWAYNIETILAEKVETILRRSVLNTRPRDFYDVYLLMRTRSKMISKEIFLAALNATSQKRMSLAALHNYESIIRSIEIDAIMRERWERYCYDNYYARDIVFDEVIKVLTDLLSSEST
jgi:predicted nucleotidyltransferase component of viral defense system